MNLFAITDLAGSRVVRFPMSAELSDEVRIMFETQRDSFFRDIEDIIPFEGSVLKFQSFHFAKRVFELSEYYREATNEEVTAFAQHEKFSVDDINQFVLDAGPQTRKKISFILQSGVLENFAIEQISAAANAMQLDLDFSTNGKIIIPNNKTDLKKLLRFLEEDYYESPLSNTRYISNSKRVAN